MAEEIKSSKDWQELTHLTQGQPIIVERVRFVEKDIAIEGRFELPQLARLSADDQIFITAFVRSHGSIKEMERIFGVSYPTIKSRLTRIANNLEFVETNPTPSRAEILQRLQPGEPHLPSLGAIIPDLAVAAAAGHSAFAIHLHPLSVLPRESVTWTGCGLADPERPGRHRH